MTRLTSFTPPLKAAVIGASGSIGGAFVGHLRADPSVARIYAFSRSPLAGGAKVTAGRLDYDDESSIAAAAESTRDGGPLDLVIVASGLLHEGPDLQPEKSYRMLAAEPLARAFRVNAIGPALVARHFLPLLARDRKAVFAALSARVGSIGDNRLGGWYGYRAAKAALNMTIRCLAIEVARNRKQTLCVGLHPGTVDTALSKPFQGGVAEDRLFTPERSAGHLLDVLDGLTPADSGKVFAWDGTEVPP